jgi:hypothetical protein
MTAHAGQRRSECCWQAWERMLTHNVRPSKGHFLALFDASVAKDAARTKEAVELMYEAGITLQPHRVLAALRILLSIDAIDTAILVCRDEAVRNSLSNVVKAIESGDIAEAKRLIQPHNNHFASASNMQSGANESSAWKSDDAWKGSNRPYVRSAARYSPARAA